MQHAESIDNIEPWPWTIVEQPLGWNELEPPQRWQRLIEQPARRKPRAQQRAIPRVELEPLTL
ncbi:MAG TPA: hypothetical protein VFV78_06105 [Vicinamibacterales bacterium]|nr:hypothetical protein [Vicinamibacterales bacterium]